MRKNIIACFMACGLAVVAQTGRAAANNTQSYDVIEHYTGGSADIKFSIDLDQKATVYPQQQNSAWFSLSSVSITYTGLDLGFVPNIAYSGYEQNSNGTSFLDIYDADETYYSGIYLSQAFTYVNTAAVLGASDIGNSYIYSASGTLYTDVSTVTSSVAQPVPEPASMALLGAGLLGLAGARRRRG